MPEISESAQKSALAIVEHIKRGAPDLDLCEVSQGGDCRDFKGCADHAANVLAAIILRHAGEEWRTDRIPFDRRVLVSVKYEEGYPPRTGIAEAVEKDGEIDVVVDDGIERFSLDFPGTIYAWQELPEPMKPQEEDAP